MLRGYIYIINYAKQDFAQQIRYSDDEKGKISKKTLRRCAVICGHWYRPKKTVYVSLVNDEFTDTGKSCKGEAVAKHQYYTAVVYEMQLCRECTLELCQNAHYNSIDTTTLILIETDSPI